MYLNRVDLQVIYAEVKPDERGTRIADRVRIGVVALGVLSLAAFIVGLWRSTYLF
jgi:hypothetical protein